MPASASIRRSSGAIRLEQTADKSGMAKSPTAKKAAPPMTTAEAALAALLAHGLDTIYALPGVHNDDFFDALAKATRRKPRGHPHHPHPP